ncbi:MAG: DNA polymerase IV, partial [Asgard group archaeon]|nr:DNA polymerase IV [Asgard group archaeon]
MVFLQLPKVTKKTPQREGQFLFHVDLDCFFAAVEIREDPELEGKPVAVGGNRETRRGVVTSCNYIARKFGLHAGMPINKALDLCPDLICTGRHHSLYRDVSDNIMSILSSYTDEIRVASIDEAYLNLTSEVENVYDGDPLPLAKQMKTEIYEAEQINSSIGIGPNTTIAKIATGEAKPDGIKYVPPEKIIDFLTPLSIRKMSGIGPKTTESLKRRHGIETIGQIIAVGDEVEMLRKFGDLGKFFYRIISGRGRTIIKPINTYGAKSISNGRTFWGQMDDGEQVTPEKILPKLIDSVHDRLVKKNFKYKTVTLAVRLQDNFQNINRSRSFLAANDDKERIKTTVYEILEEVRHAHNNAPIRKVA